MVQMTVTLFMVAALLVSVIGTPIKTKVRRRSAAYRGRTLNELLRQNLNTKQFISIGGENNHNNVDLLGKASVNGQIIDVTQGEAYELYTRYNTPQERREVLAPDTEGNAFGTCVRADEMIWPGNCERIEGNDQNTVCRVPATGVTEMRGRNCAPLGISIQSEEHATERTGVAMINGRLTTISRAKAFDLYVENIGEAAQKRRVLAPMDNDRIFGTCTVTEQLIWPGNCEHFRPPSLGLSICKVPSAKYIEIKTRGCINGDTSTFFDFLMSLSNS